MLNFIENKLLFRSLIFALFCMVPTVAFAPKKKRGMFASVMKEVMEAQRRAHEKAVKEAQRKAKQISEIKKAKLDLSAGRISEYTPPSDSYWFKDEIKFGKDDVEALEEVIQRYEKQREAADKERQEAAKSSRETNAEIGKSLANALGDTMRMEAMRNENIVKENMKNASSERKLDKVLDFFKSPKNIAILAGAAVGIIGGYYVIKHGTRIIAAEVEKRLGKPKIITETSRTTWWQRMTGKVPKVEKLSMDDFIADDEFKGKLENLIQYYVNANVNDDPLPNMTCYGLPGTGKTYFVTKILAHLSNCDYAFVSGNALSEMEPSEGIAELRKIFGWAEHSKKRVIIVFDEAEGYLGRRNKVSIERRKTITEFLSLIPKAYNERFSVVLITNRLNDLDPAVISRMAKRIKFDTPKAPQLETMIGYYAEKTAAAKGFELEAGIEGCYADLAVKAEKSTFVGRDIDKIFNVWVVEAVRRSEDNVVTEEIVRNAFEEQIADLKKEKEYDFDALTSGNKPSGLSAGVTGVSVSS